MALDATKFYSGAQFGDGTKLWTYQTADPLATVVGSGYFDGVANLVRPGDVIFAKAATFDTIIVATNSGGVVTTTRASLS